MSNETRTNGYGGNESSSAVASEDAALTAPYTYLCQAPGPYLNSKCVAFGKHVRGKLALAFNHWLRIGDDKLAAICDIVQQLHNASLIIDDIEDDSTLRRGVPCAHSIYGVARTINAANYVYFRALAKCAELGHPLATVVFTEHMLELHRGQGMDIYWRDTVQCPSESEYRRMVQQKTGGLFGLAVGLMQLFSTNHEMYTPLINALGLLFQIRDDYANLVSQEYADKKSYAEDLTEGKFSFPIVYAIKSQPRADELISIIRQKPKSYEVKHYCVQLLHKLGALKYTRNVLLELDSEVVAEVSRLGGNAHLMAVLSELREVYAMPIV